MADLPRGNSRDGRSVTTGRTRPPWTIPKILFDFWKRLSSINLPVSGGPYGVGRWPIDLPGAWRYVKNGESWAKAYRTFTVKMARPA